jgi:signal transduction histidine kinase
MTTNATEGLALPEEETLHRLEPKPTESTGTTELAPDNLLSINLASLVDHRESISATETVGRAYEIFERVAHEYLAVVEGGQFVGLVAKGRIGFLLGSRRGFSAYGNQSIRDHLLPDVLRVHLATPIQTVLHEAFHRSGEAFYDDVALTDATGDFLGVIAFKTLVLLQSRLTGEKQRFIEAQHRELQKRNLELSQTVRELRRFRGRFGILFQNSVLSVILVNALGEIEVCNSRFEQLFRDACCRERTNLFDLVVPRDLERLRRAMPGPPRSDERKPCAMEEFQFAVRGGGCRIFEVFINPIAETGQVCVLFNDVTEHHAMKRRLAQREKAELIESLAGGIAHEINNKITPTLACAELLQDFLTQAHPEATFYAQVIKESALDTAKIVRQLLQLNRPATSELV